MSSYFKNLIEVMGGAVSIRTVVIRSPQVLLICRVRLWFTPVRGFYHRRKIRNALQTILRRINVFFHRCP